MRFTKLVFLGLVNNHFELFEIGDLVEFGKLTSVCHASVLLLTKNFDNEVKVK